MIWFYLLILLIPLMCLRRRTVDDPEIMDSKSTTCVKGLLCIYVMLHNLGLDYEGNSKVMEVICEHTGGIGVGIFFFLSAYGIIRAYQLKGNKYLPKLLFVNVLKLYFISVCINLLTYFVFFQGAFETKELMFRMFNIGFYRMNRHGWYISTIIVLYILFAIVYFLCSKLKTEKRFIIAGIILALIATSFRITAIMCDKGGMYTREILCFSIGCIYATFYKQFNDFFKKNWWLCITLLSIGLWVGMFTWEPIGAWSASLLVPVVSLRFTYYNKVSYFLGKICIYIYLFVHFSSLVFQQFLGNQYWWILTNFGLILELSLACYFIEYIIKNIIRHLKKYLKNNRELLN